MLLFFSYHFLKIINIFPCKGLRVVRGGGGGLDGGKLGFKMDLCVGGRRFWWWGEGDE